MSFFFFGPDGLTCFLFICSASSFTLKRRSLLAPCEADESDSRLLLLSLQDELASESGVPSFFATVGKLLVCLKADVSDLSLSKVGLCLRASGNIEWSGEAGVTGTDFDVSDDIRFSFAGNGGGIRDSSSAS